MPKLLEITPYPILSADTRYRLTQFTPILKENGWKVTLRPFMSEKFFRSYFTKGKMFEKILRTAHGFFSRLIICLSAGKFDAVIIHKEAFPFGPLIFERIIKFFQPNIIYDMDDAFWTHPPQFNQIGRWFRDPQKIRKIIQMSSVVLAGNEYIADYARKFNSNVINFPTVLDMTYYLPRKEIEDDIITIGWVGRWSSQSYLMDLENVFKQLIKKYPKIKFRFVGASADFPLPDIPAEIIDWKLEEEISALIPFDIGIMPLPDDEYSRGKCGFKLLQYMALSIPSIASPVGVNQEIIIDGENGFLATSNQDWLSKLSLLIEQPDLRSSIGLNARNTVEEDYSLNNYSPKLLDLLNQIIA